MQVEQIWQEITNNFEQRTVRDVWWTKILQKYSAEGRNCHGVEHLEAKFHYLNTVKPQLKNFKAVAMALLFQYYEYDPRAGDNHEKNTSHFREFANEIGIQTESELHRDVVGLLEAADTSSTDEHKMAGVYGSEDKHYFLDLDMVVLGAEPEEYDHYTNSVQEEYSFLPSNLYSNLRLKVLRSFLQIPNIFATREFRDRFEQQARNNIQKEVDKLKWKQ